MAFTRDSLWALRQEVILNSLFIADYRNSRHIDPHVVCDFFDGFLEDVEARMEEEIPGFNDVHFFDHLPKYDNPDTLWDYYCSIELDLLVWRHFFSNVQRLHLLQNRFFIR